MSGADRAVLRAGAGAGARPRGVAATIALAAVAALLLAPAALAAQDADDDERPDLPDPLPQVVPPPPPGQDSVTAVPGGEYSNGGLRRTLLGAGHRELWTTPHRVRVFHLGLLGGLEPEERGGTSQSITLHMLDPEGREQHFRSVNKWTHQGLPADLQLTPLGRLIQDQTGALHPGGALVIPPLLEAAGILHVTPELYVMSDDPRLGRFRETFPGMVGIVEEAPNEGPDDEPLFADSRTIAGMDRVLEHLEERPGDRANARDYLTARLVDMLVGDTDRGQDNWRWARYGEEGRYTWEPIPRDRDWAFVRADGWIPTLGRRLYPKLGRYDETYDLTSLTIAARAQDRRLLAELPRETWDSVAHALRADLTDDVLRRAARSLPPEQAALQAEELERLLRARRDRLPEIALEWYREISGEVDVRARDGGDRAEIERLDDGSVRLTLLWPVDAEGRALPEDPDDFEPGGPGPDTARWEPYFTRTFLPDETREVRVYLHGGDDVAVVRGRSGAAAAVAGPIGVRLIGGGGDDLLVDSSAVAGRAGDAVAFHDDRGDNRLLPAERTEVDTRPWDDPEPPSWFAARLSDEDFRDWGGSTGWSPRAAYSDEAGPVLGVTHSRTRYGFRQVPWSSRIEVGAEVGLASGALAVEASWAGRRPNSPHWLRVAGRASEIETLRFHGFGNDTPLGPDRDLDQVEERYVEAGAELLRDWGPPGSPVATLSVGPVVRYTDPEAPPGSALQRLRPRGVGGFGQVGLRSGVSMGRDLGEGPFDGDLTVEAGAGLFPPVWDASDWFGDLHLTARFRTPPAGPLSLLLRGGAERVWGPFPVHEAAFIGGLESLRGFRYRRFAGDAALQGGAELDVRLGEVTLLTRGRFGLTGLADAGRVWIDGDSRGGWHQGYGAGVWFESLGAVLRVSWARGEEDRIYGALETSF